MRFEWDNAKDETNQRKHGVSFTEARTVFFDDHAILYDDPDHSEGEERFLLVGVSAALRILVVVHCARGGTAGVDGVRIISARRATKREREALSTARRKS